MVFQLYLSLPLVLLIFPTAFIDSHITSLSQPEECLLSCSLSFKFHICFSLPYKSPFFFIHCKNLDSVSLFTSQNCSYQSYLHILKTNPFLSTDCINTLIQKLIPSHDDCHSNFPAFQFKDTILYKLNWKWAPFKLYETEVAIPTIPTHKSH